MSDGRLTFEHGQLRLNGSLVPGILKNQVIKGSVRFDTADPDGHSGTVRTPLGWEDSDIVLVVELISEEQTVPYTGTQGVYEKLAQINRIFKGRDNGANPKIYDVDNVHANARDISQVVFSGLQSIETDEDDVLEVHMNFTEHRPYEQVVEGQVSVSDKPYTDGGTTGDPELASEIMVDVS